MAPSRVAPEAAVRLPPTYQSWVRVTGSPSSSVVVTVAVMVSLVYTLPGDKVTLVTMGGLLEATMVRLSDRAVPASVPSKGVMVQVTTSSETKPLARVLLVPTTVPTTVQLKVEASASPSRSA